MGGGGGGGRDGGGWRERGCNSERRLKSGGGELRNLS